MLGLACLVQDARLPGECSGRACHYSCQSIANPAVPLRDPSRTLSDACATRCPGDPNETERAGWWPVVAEPVPEPVPSSTLAGLTVPYSSLSLTCTRSSEGVICRANAKGVSSHLGKASVCERVSLDVVPLPCCTVCRVPLCNIAYSSMLPLTTFVRNYYSLRVGTTQRTMLIDHPELSCERSEAKWSLHTVFVNMCHSGPPRSTILLPSRGYPAAIPQLSHRYPANAYKSAE